MSLKLDHSIVLERKALRQLNPEKQAAQIKKIKERILAAGRDERGWSCGLKPAEAPRFSAGYNIYRWALNLKYEPKREKTQEQVNSELGTIAQIAQKAGNAAEWSIISINGKSPDEALLATVDEEGRTHIGYAPVSIPRDWRKNFEHIYDREAQIEIIYSYIDAAIQSDWKNRFHAALVGEPAGGKTETARAFKRMLGDAAVLELDATATTMAGVIEELRNRDELPRVVIIEEIEKCDPKNLPWLLGLLDPRAEIRKLNFRTKVLLETKMLCLATINNYKLFGTVLEGALASRFGEPIFFPRPGMEVLRLILEREIAIHKGNLAWIDPVLKYAQEADITDPRSIIKICLAGKDDLLGKGKYQEKLRKTRLPSNYGKIKANIPVEDVG